MNLADTHCHLHDSRYNGKNNEIIENAIDSGVMLFLNCGTSPADWEEVAAISRIHKEVIPAFGIHPWFVENICTEWEEILKDYITRYNGAIGEIGLDRVRGAKNGMKQELFFTKQLDLAAEYDTSVSIHCVRSWDRLIPLIKKSPVKKENVIIHSFSGNLYIAQKLLDMGCNISFSCSITNENNKKAIEVIKHIDISKILTETDSPDIAPYNTDTTKTTLNTPSNVAMVIKRISQIKNIGLEETANCIFNNAVRVFKKNLKYPV